jgi:hypothetical protein
LLILVVTRVTLDVLVLMLEVLIIGVVTNFVEFIFVFRVFVVNSHVKLQLAILHVLPRGDVLFEQIRLLYLADVQSVLADWHKQTLDQGLCLIGQQWLLHFAARFSREQETTISDALSLLLGIVTERKRWHAHK